MLASDRTRQVNPPNKRNINEALKRDIFINLNVMQVGFIQEFDSEKQTVSVQVAIKHVVETKPDGTKVYQEYPVLVDCPMMMLFGASAYITMPVAKGDECLVFFNDREMDNWFVTGNVATPLTYRAHDLSDGFAFVGVKSLKNSIQNYLTNGLRVAFNDDCKIDLTNDEINSFVETFIQNGDMVVTGGLQILGDLTGNLGTVNVNADVQLAAGKELHDGRACNGNFNSVVVVDGIVVSGTP